MMQTVQLLLVLSHAPTVHRQHHVYLPISDLWLQLHV